MLPHTIPLPEPGARTPPVGVRAALNGRAKTSRLRGESAVKAVLGGASREGAGQAGMVRGKVGGCRAFW